MLWLGVHQQSIQTIPVRNDSIWFSIYNLVQLFLEGAIIFLLFFLLLSSYSLAAVGVWAEV